MDDLRPSRNIRPFPKFSQPKIEGAFSVDSQRNYIESFQNIKYLQIPSVVNFNLNDGDEDYVDKSVEPAQEKLKHLLMFVTKNIKTISKPDFVCFRGLLR
jgi:hypothetical protein